uniref:hypothetical protein n=1 Tax=Agathobacter sp. TaxID=2021311 RepID=UPI004057B153
MPTLLPFSILSAILLRSNLLVGLHKHGNLLAICMTMFCGFIFGFPIGSKLTADFYKKQMLTKKQAHILAVVTNNFSPMYVCGFALPLLFPDTDYQAATYLLLYLFPLLAGSILLILPAKEQDAHSVHHSDHKNTTSRFQLDMQIIDAGIVSSFETLIRICGYIVIFSLLSAILQSLFQKPIMAAQLLIGNMEITNGIALFSNYDMDAKTKYVCIIQILSLGGLSGFAQTASILNGSKLSLKKYCMGKCMLSLITTLLAIVFMYYI